MPVTHTLPVHLSREELHTVETVESFEATGPFDIEILNHGRDVHPHLKLSDSLARVATIEEGNPYVASDESVRIRVDTTPPPEPVSGVLTIETGYGQESGAVRVTVRRPDSDEMPVDEDLGKPRTAGTDPEETVEELSAPDVGLSSESLPVAILALAALLIAALTAAIIEDIVVIAGVVAVLVAVVMAAVLLLR